MKFAHFSDCHLGGWKDPKLTILGQKTFEQAIEYCIQEHIDFILIAGDLFNTALPSIDVIKETTRILKKAHDAHIPVYTIPGSHDFSAAGKTMLDVLEHAGLLINVMKYHNNQLEFITDPKTGVKLAGFYGKKGGLEKFELQELEKKNLEDEPGFKIFLFHTGIQEFLPKEMGMMECSSRETLPKHFNYYAGGHIHYIYQHKQGNSLLAFPGALFPNNFKELEEFHHGGMYIVDEHLNYEWKALPQKEVYTIHIHAEHKTPTEVNQEILQHTTNIHDKIILIRITGELASGKPSDINMDSIHDAFSDAYVILTNTAKLSAKSYELVQQHASIEELEQDILHKIELGTMQKEHQETLASMLMHTLNTEKMDGEKNIHFEERIIKETNMIFDFEP